VTNTTNKTRYDMLLDLTCPHSDLDGIPESELREALAASDPESLVWVASLLTRALLQDEDEEDPGTYDVIGYLLDPSESCAGIRVDRDALRSVIGRLHPDDWRTIEKVWHHVRESFVPSSASAEPLNADQDIRDAAYLCHSVMIDPWDTSLDVEIGRLRDRFPWLVALRDYVELERGLSDLATAEHETPLEDDSKQIINISAYLIAGAAMKLCGQSSEPDHLAAASFIDFTQAARKSGLESLSYGILQFVDTDVFVILGGVTGLISRPGGGVELLCGDAPYSSFPLSKLTDSKLRSHIPKRFLQEVVLHNPDLAVTALLNRFVYLSFKSEQVRVPVGRLGPGGKEAGNRVRELIEELHCTNAADRFAQELPPSIENSEDVWLANDYLHRLMTLHRSFILAPRKFARSVASKAWVDAEIRDAALAMSEETN